MSLKILRNGMIGMLIASVPVASGLAATRPNTAVPLASSTVATSAVLQDDDGGISWIVIAGVAVAVGVALFLLLDNDDDGDDSVSDG